MISEAEEEISVVEPRDVREMFCYFLKERTRQSGRGLSFVALCCLAVFASAGGSGMSFDDAQTSFRRFSECALIEDFPGRNMKLKASWLQNVISEPDPASTATSDQSADQDYVVTGVVRVVTGHGSPDPELAVLREIG